MNKKYIILSIALLVGGIAQASGITISSEALGVGIRTAMGNTPSSGQNGSSRQDSNSVAAVSFQGVESQVTAFNASLNKLNSYANSVTGGCFSCISAKDNRELKAIIEEISTSGTNVVAQCRGIHNQSVEVHKKSKEQANERSWKGWVGAGIGVISTVLVIAAVGWTRANFDIQMSKKSSGSAS